MTDDLKLAEQAGIPFNKYGLVGCDTCETDIDDALQCFADLIRADERQRLIGASVEPVAWMYDWYADENEVVTDWISKDYEEANSPTMGCHNIRPLFTADALAARVAQMQGEIDRLQREVVNRNQRALDGDKAVAVREQHVDEILLLQSKVAQLEAARDAARSDRNDLADDVTHLKSKVAQLEVDAKTPP